MSRRAAAPDFSVLICSSSEGLHVARRVRDCLENRFQERFGAITVWNERGVFESGESYIESLERALGEHDFAVLVLLGEDKSESRGVAYSQVRDNVLFELGLFIGALGRKKTFAFRSTEADLKIPSDLRGVTMFEFDPALLDDQRHFDPECGRLGQSILERAKPDFSKRSEYFVIFPSLRDDPFYLDLLAGISSSATTQKDMTFLAPQRSYSGQQYLERLDALLQRQDEFAGGLIAPTLEGIGRTDMTARIDKFEIPIIIVDINPYEDADLPPHVGYVGFDNRDGGKEAAKAMAEVLGPALSDKHVLILGNSDQRKRHEGFIDTWQGNSTFRTCRFNRKEARDVVNRLITHSEAWFDGIFGVSDEIALGAVQALCDRGLDTPVIGFDATQAATLLIDLKQSPLFNTVVQDAHLLGEKAIHRLKRMISGDQLSNPKEIIACRLYV